MQSEQQLSNGSYNVHSVSWAFMTGESCNAQNNADWKWLVHFSLQQQQKE